MDVDDRVEVMLPKNFYFQREAHFLLVRNFFRGVVGRMVVEDFDNDTSIAKLEWGSA